MVRERGLWRDRAQFKLSGHDAQCVSGDTSVEGELAGAGRHDLAGEELPDGLKQFARRGPSVRSRGRVRGASDARAAACAAASGASRSSKSHSCSHTRRPTAASSTDRYAPDR
jgi:hypothetical protein